MNIPNPDRPRLPRILFFALLTAPILILLITQYSDLDLALADFFFDQDAHVFPWRYAWITDAFGHVILKRIFIALAGIPLLLCVWDIVRPIRKWSAWFRLRMRVIALSAVCIPLSVSMLKALSFSHCPWDLERYGGTVPYIRLLESLPASISPGHCFPAGHATSALWLVSIGLFWWPHRPRAAILICFLMLLLGFGVGWMQQMRGAHFLSHTLWSMWMASVIVAGLFVILDRFFHQSAVNSFKP